MRTKKEPDPQLMPIANRIKELRIKAGYTSYANFALKNGLESKQYWRLESGYNFHMTTMLRIAQIHNLTLEEFFKDIC